MSYYRRFLEYKRRYDKEHYRRVTVRKDLYERLFRNLCPGLRLNECIEKVLALVESAGEKTRGLSDELRADLCRFIATAVRLANKHPSEPEADILYRMWDKVAVICEGEE